MIKLHWTAAGFVERIRTRLAQTARGERRGPDQTAGASYWVSTVPLILPTELFNDEQPVQPARPSCIHLQDCIGRCLHLSHHRESERISDTSNSCIKIHLRTPAS